jgi:hypothetical protein
MISGRRELNGGVATFKYGKSDSLVPSLTTTKNGGAGTINRLSTSIGANRYYLYDTGSSYGVKGYDSASNLLFDYDTGLAWKVTPSIVATPDGRVCIFDGYYDGSTEYVFRSIILSSASDPISHDIETTTVSALIGGFTGPGYAVDSITAERVGNTVLVAMDFDGGSNSFVIITRFYNGSFDGNCIYSMNAYTPAITHSGDIRFGNSRDGIGYVPLYVPTVSFTEDVTGSNYNVTMLRVMVSENLQLATAEAIYSNYEGWDTGLNHSIELELALSGTAQEFEMQAEFSAFLGDVDLILCSSYFNSDGFLVEGLTKNRIFIHSNTEERQIDISESITSAKKPFFYSYEDGLVSVCLLDFTDPADVIAEQRTYDYLSLSVAKVVTTTATGHDATGSSICPYGHADYLHGTVMLTRYAAASNQFLVLDHSTKKGMYLDEVVAEVPDIEIPAPTGAFSKLKGGFPDQSYVEIRNAFAPFILYDRAGGNPPSGGVADKIKGGTP